MTEHIPIQEKEQVIPQGTILVVDDEPSIRDFMHMMLEHSGYSVVEAANGREAIGQIKQHYPAIHLVVTDIHMPQMDGIELIEHLQESYPEIKIIIITADPQFLEENGYDDTMPLLSKPFDPDTLLQSVRTVFESFVQTPID